MTRSRSRSPKKLTAKQKKFIVQFIKKNWGEDYDNTYYDEKAARWVSGDDTLAFKAIDNLMKSSKKGKALDSKILLCVKDIRNIKKNNISIDVLEPQEYDLVTQLNQKNDMFIEDERELHPKKPIPSSKCYMCLERKRLGAKENCLLHLTKYKSPDKKKLQKEYENKIGYFYIDSPKKLPNSVVYSGGGMEVWLKANKALYDFCKSLQKKSH